MGLRLLSATIYHTKPCCLSGRKRVGITQAEAYRVLRKGGTLVAYGMSAAVTGGMSTTLATLLRLGVYKLIPDGKGCRFYGIHDQQIIQEDLTRLLAMLAEGKLKPIIAAKLPLSRIAEAHRLMDTAAVAGKVLLVPGD